MIATSQDNLPLWARLRLDGETSPQDVLTRFEIYSPPVPVFTIAKRLGAQVRPADTDVSGAVHVAPGLKATIWVNPADSKTRQRFTVAHEIGHLLLHMPADRPAGSFEMRDKEWGVRSPAETQANVFAAELIMPEPMVVGFMYEQRVLDVPELAKLFAVSNAAMQIRVDWILRGQALE